MFPSFHSWILCIISPTFSIFIEKTIIFFFKCSHLSSHIILISSIKRRTLFSAAFTWSRAFPVRKHIRSSSVIRLWNFLETLMMWNLQMTHDVLGNTCSLTTTSEHHLNTLVSHSAVAPSCSNNSNNKEDNQSVSSNCFKVVPARSQSGLRMKWRARTVDDRQRPIMLLPSEMLLLCCSLKTLCSTEALSSYFNDNRTTLHCDVESQIESASQQLDNSCTHSWQRPSCLMHPMQLLSFPPF